MMRNKYLSSHTIPVELAFLSVIEVTHLIDEESAASP